MNLRLITLYLLINLACGYEVIVSLNSFEEFANFGWSSPCQGVGNAEELPENLPSHVRSLAGSDLWYYTNEVATQFDISWNIPEEIVAESTYLRLTIFYYTNAGVTVQEVVDDYLQVIPPTGVDSVWGIAHSNIQLHGELSPSCDWRKNNSLTTSAVIFCLMAPPNGYIIFDRMQVEYECQSTTTSPTSTWYSLPTTSISITDATTVEPTPFTTTTFTPTPATSTFLPSISTTTETPTHSTSTSSFTTLSATSSSFTLTSITTEQPTTSAAVSTSPVTTTTQALNPSTTAFSSTTGDCSLVPEIPGDKCHPSLCPCDEIKNSDCQHDNFGLYRCFCLDGYDVSLNGKRCVKTAEFVNDGCDSDLQCRNLQSTWCQQSENGYKYCVCIDQFTESETRKYCLPKIKYLDGLCQEHGQCEPLYSRCYHEKCTCTAGYVGSLSKLQCLKTLWYNDDCEEDVQCQANLGSLSACDEFCICLPNSHYYNRFCHKSAILGQRCSKYEECVIGVNSTRVECHLGICRCEPLAIDWNQSCYKDKVVGDRCDRKEECQVPIMGQVECILNECMCKQGFRKGDQGKSCRGSGGFLHINNYALVFFSSIMQVWIIKL